MELKSYVWLGIIIGGAIGGGLGAILDHGNPFGAWGITFGTLGSLAGIWVGYRFYQG